MSLPNSVMRATFDGSAYASTTVFPVAFSFQNTSDLRVTKIAVGGAQSVLVENTSYSVAGAGRLSGGTVSLIGFVLVAGEFLIIERIPPPIQLTDFSNQGEIYPEVAEAALDYVTQVLQSHEDQLGVHDDAKTKVLKLLRHGTNGSSSYDARSNKIANVDDPTEDQDAATKKYVDTVVGGIASGGGGAFISVTVTALPSPSSTYDGLVYRLRNASLPDSLHVCLRQSDGVTYEWVGFAAAFA